MKFVDKQLALKLKEKGFDKPCFGWYYINTPCGRIDEDINYYSTNSGGVIYEDCLYSNNLNDFYGNTADAPTIEQTLEWLREEKNVHIGIIPCFMMSPKNNIMWLWEILVGKIIECKNTIYADKDYNYTELASVNYYANYENACIAGIEYIVDNLI